MSNEAPEVDNLSKLPVEILMNIALDLPLEDIQALCATSSKLARLCDNRAFWQIRLSEDFPMHADAIPAEMSPYEYYVALDRVWNLTDNNGNYLVQDIERLSGYENRSQTLLYPVPSFVRDSEGSILGDIAISDINRPYILVGVHPRKVTPKIFFPASVLKRKINIISDPVDREKYASAARELQDKGYTEVYMVNSKELEDYVDQAEDKGYLSLSQSAMFTVIDDDLFQK